MWTNQAIAARPQPAVNQGEEASRRAVCSGLWMRSGSPTMRRLIERFKREYGIHVVQLEFMRVGGKRGEGCASNILGFYMGKNTPKRKDYIMENLVVPVED